MINFTAIDFETATGKRSSACAVGIVNVQNGRIVDEFTTLIKPPNNDYSYHNIKVHGINRNDTDNALLFCDIYPEIKKRIEGKTIVAHNESFDRSVLSSTMEFYGLNYSELSLPDPWECTLRIYRQKGYKPASLNECCKRSGLKLTHHNALSDARACAMLFLKHISEDISGKIAQLFEYFSKTNSEELLLKFFGPIIKEIKNIYDNQLISDKTSLKRRFERGVDIYDFSSSEVDIYEFTSSDYVNSGECILDIESIEDYTTIKTVLLKIRQIMKGYPIEDRISEELSGLVYCIPDIRSIEDYTTIKTELLKIKETYGYSELDEKILRIELSELNKRIFRIQSIQDKIQEKAIILMNNIKQTRINLLLYLQKNDNQVFISDLPYLKMVLGLFSNADDIDDIETIFSLTIDELIKEDRIYLTDQKIILKKELADCMLLPKSQTSGVTGRKQNAKNIEKREHPKSSDKARPAELPQKSEPGEIWTEPFTGMEFVWVPGGSYMMGSDAPAADDEKPMHEVCLVGFWIGKYPVTQGQWQKIMGNNPSHFKSGDDFPVEMVSWDGARQFISRLNQESGQEFALPTEAQWEYAAKSMGKDETYAGGNDVDAVAWYVKNSGGKTHPVGTKAPNGLGIYDMNGNVWEWCADVYEKDAYSKHVLDNPVITANNETSARVSRGGCWYFPRIVRAVSRGRNTPDTRGSNLGFRLSLPRTVSKNG